MTTSIESPIGLLELDGCRSEPLSGYLKALGVFRLVAEQLDSAVKVCWERNRMTVMTGATREQLVEFFLRRYCPSPVLSPWNGGSGFFPGDSTKGLDAILASDDPRFRLYSQAIRDVQSWPEFGAGPRTVGAVLKMLDDGAAKKKEGSKQRNALETMARNIRDAGEEALKELGAGKVKETLSVNCADEVVLDVLGANQKKLGKKAAEWWNAVKKGRTACSKEQRAAGKEELIAVCRSRLNDACLPWIDAAIVILRDDKAAYNPVLGSGGNEGRLDFSNNFMQLLAGMLLDNNGDSRDLLEEALFGNPCEGFADVKVGQFNPGRAGGYNQGMEVETKDFKANPWEFLLMIEGTLMFSAALYKRGQAEARGYAAVPFTSAFSSVGFGSDVQDEAGKAETWLPLWERPASYPEVRALFSEGRASIGRRGVKNGVEFARAMGTLGVDRGIARFVRYAFLKRRGESFVALPAGQIPVRMCPGMLLFEELDFLMWRMDAFLSQFQNVPVTLSSPRRQLDQAIFAACEDPCPRTFVRVLTALGAIERAIALRDRGKKPKLDRPLQGLSPKWILESDDESGEFRIAAALASVRRSGKVGPLRANLAPVDPKEPSQWVSGNGQRFWHGNSLVERLGGVAAQRMMDAERLGAPVPPFDAHLSLAPHDALPFLLGETDDNRIEDLLWAFTLVDWRKPGLFEVRQKWRKSLVAGPLPRGWCLLKLLHQSSPVRGRELRPEPRIITLLRAGRADEAVAVARARLRASDIPPLSLSGDDWIAPERQLASLLVPLCSISMLESLVLEDS